MAEEMGNEEDVLEKLREHGQQHIVEWLDRLEEPARARLLAQVAGLDFDRLEDLKNLIGVPPTDISFSDVKPAPVEELAQAEADRKAEEEVIELGRRALREDRVAAVTVAGGQGTRLGYDHPKGMFPISPIRHKSLFELFAEQILAARRRYGCGLPWLIMTSPLNNEETRLFFEANNYFGLGAESVHFFIQKQNPILDVQGRLLLKEEDELLTGPDGHGGTFDALEQAGLLGRLREGGYDLISYFQVDNPLVTVADPRYIGYHLARDAEFSCKVVTKRDPEEGLGIAVLMSGQPAVVEYIDVPDEVAGKRLPDGRLKYRFGSIAIHIINVSFADHVANSGKGLPWHVAEKTYEIIDENGEKVESQPDGCRKFERFIFDALQFADSCAFVEVDRETEFAPVKTAEGEDSPQTCRQALQKMWLDWVKQVTEVPDLPAELAEPIIEISPLFASDAAELAERVPQGWRPPFPLLLEADAD